MKIVDEPDESCVTLWFFTTDATKTFHSMESYIKQSIKFGHEKAMANIDAGPIFSQAVEKLNTYIELNGTPVCATVHQKYYYRWNYCLVHKDAYTATLSRLIHD